MRETGDDTFEKAAIPDVIVERDQWVCWREEKRDGKPTKVPVTPGSGAFASTTDPDTWTNFETAFEFADAGDADGVGFVFCEDDSMVGIDLDDCRIPETGNPDSTAEDVIDRLDSYTEVSPSGTGFHVLVKGDLPDGRNRRGSVELYESARFFTVTGDHVGETPAQVAGRQDALEAIHRDYVRKEAGDTDEPGDSHAGAGAPPIDDSADIRLDDAEVVEKARGAENGKKFEQLWNGTTASYDSHSEADMALCCLLAFWTAGDQSQMDRLFRQSGLMREKWEEIHYADGSTYGEKTLERAVSTVTEYYDPEAASRPDPTGVPGTGTPTQQNGDGPQHNPAYLAERNQLLAERVSELESTLEGKNERIEALEAELRQLEEERT